MSGDNIVIPWSAVEAAAISLKDSLRLDGPDFAWGPLIDATEAAFRAARPHLRMGEEAEIGFGVK
jgi:hypothetical protein